LVGAFTLYSDQVNFFDDPTRELLLEMATDISFALDGFDHELRRRLTEQEIELKRTILKTQQETSLDAILVVSEDGEIISYNQQFVALWRLSPQLANARLNAPILKSVAELVENPEVFVARVNDLNKHRGDKSREDVLLKDGRIIDQYSAPVTGSDQQHYGRVWYFRDITERREADRRVIYLNRVYAVLSGINALIVRVQGRDELFNEACRIAVESGGFRMAMIAMVNQNTMTLVPIASVGKDEALLNAVKHILASGENAEKTMGARSIREKQPVVSNDSQNDPQVVFSAKYAQAGIHSMAVFPLMVSDEAVGVLALYASEIEFFRGDELKLLNELAGDVAFAVDHIDKRERLNYLAYYDALTGLANRSLFLERVALHLRNAASGDHQLALFLIDLERFRNINDSLGRAAGDELLQQVAQWLTDKAGDVTLLARLGVDHFAMVMPVVKPAAGLVPLIEKTLASFVAHPFRLNDDVFRIAAKVGIALSPANDTDAETLLRNGEAALKRAKMSGERYLFYTQSMIAAVAGQLSLENQLRQALINGEFVLHYQPKVNLQSGKMTSAEALIRWNKPGTGLVPPGQFIPILEETGLIYEVGRWALHQAIADYLRWRAAGLPAVRLAVNVSPLQLRHRGFIAEIEQAIGIDTQAAAGLELEITESLIMSDVNGCIATLHKIRAMGVSIAIDDFGTGFSSLSYLAKLPVDKLKIDRSFVTDMAVGPQGLALVSTIINLAHALKLMVVAEGVETQDQAHLLRVLNCDEMQGYLFSKPVPADIFEMEFLAELIAEPKNPGL
jgi:diguanylate cyclase (GGDEF)-like protein